MPELWIAFIVLTIMAFVVILMPVISHVKNTALISESNISGETSIDSAAAKRANLALFNDRLNELSHELEDQKITQKEFTELKLELEKTLLNDISDNSVVVAPQKLSRPRVIAIAALSLVGIPLVSVMMYDRLGSYQELKQAQWTEETRATLAESGGNVGDMLQQLEKKLATNPQHIEGWFLLGRSYLSMQRYPEASRAYEQLITLLNAQGENPAHAYGLLAQSIYFATGEVSPGVQSAVDKALAADPNEGNALSLLGIAAYQERRYEEAIEYWQQILNANPNDPNTEALRDGVLRAQQLIKERDALAESAEQSEPAQATTENSQTSQATADESGVELQVRVTLPDDLSNNVAPGDTVFILARPVGGRMPLAVTRHSAGELPVTVTLNDSMAMGPMAKLSSAEQVEVIARISKTGAPQAQPGDIEGIAGPIVLSQQKEIVSLLLNTVIP